MIPNIMLKKFGHKILSFIVAVGTSKILYDIICQYQCKIEAVSEQTVSEQITSKQVTSKQVISKEFVLEIR
jgi:hypothetical protein